MKLWILEAKDGAKAFRDPYRKIHRMVVRALNEERARVIATEEGGKEVVKQARYSPQIVGGPCEVFVVTDSPWEDAYQTKCVELTSEGQAGKVIHDHH